MYSTLTSLEPLTNLEPLKILSDGVCHRVVCVSTSESKPTYVLVDGHKAEPLRDGHITFLTEDEPVPEQTVQGQKRLYQCGSGLSSQQDRSWSDGHNADNGGSGQSNQASIENSALPGHQDSGDRYFSASGTISSSEEESDPGSDPDSGPNSSADDEERVCPHCTRLGTSVIHFLRTKKKLLGPQDSECCRRNIEQCIAPLMALRLNSELDLGLTLESNLDYKKTGCPDCVELATSVAQFYATKKDLELRDCKSCIYIISQCIALLQETGHLVALSSRHHEKVKRQGARWPEIQEDHIRKMDALLYLADPFNELAFTSHMCLAKEKGGVQGCLSGPKPSKPLVSLSYDAWNGGDHYLRETVAIRSDWKVRKRDVAASLDQLSWMLFNFWTNECDANTGASPVGTFGCIQQEKERIYSRPILGTKPYTQRIREGDWQTLHDLRCANHDILHYVGTRVRDDLCFSPRQCPKLVPS